MAEMTAMEFLKEYRRMCEMHDSYCSGCPISKFKMKYENCTCRMLLKDHPEEVIAMVQEWAEEHPVKTILMDLLEKYPKANPDSVIKELCPDTLGYPRADNICETGEYENRCQKCWNRTLEE